jgi:hypothetical protein
VSWLNNDIQAILGALRPSFHHKENWKMASNNFANVVSQVQQAPQNQRTEKLIDGIAQQMQQSGNAQTQQLGQELQSAKSQLVRACQQQQGG